jgi:hypothetical protein
MAAPTKEQFEADIEAMRQAIVSGERQVAIGGQSVTYNTSDAIRTARREMIQEMNRLYPSATKRSRQFNGFHAGRGFE